MNLFLLSGDLAQTLFLFAPVVILFIIFYFLMIKPERRRQQAVAMMQSQLKKDDKIITIGGIYGIVDDIKDDVVTITVASGARLKMERGAIKRIITE